MLRRLPLVISLTLGTLAAHAAELNVFAAASLSDALKELAPSYEKASGDHLRLNLAASSALARQIKEGAPADVFFSADEAKMDDLAKAGLIIAETRHTLLSNTLVIVVHAEEDAAVASPTDLTGENVKHLVLGETKTVPAGIYAREYLTQLRLWEAVSPKVVAAENVRATLAAVESGAAEAGIVYKTDALTSKKVKIAYEVPAADGPKIAYPLARLRESKHPTEATRLLQFLRSPEALQVFAKFGFLTDLK